MLFHCLSWCVWGLKSAPPSHRLHVDASRQRCLKYVTLAKTEELRRYPMITSAHIIFLNGTSSAGKTSIARLLQEQLPAPYLHIALDTFLNMFPPHWVETPEGFGSPSPSGND